MERKITRLATWTQLALLVATLSLIPSDRSIAADPAKPAFRVQVANPFLQVRAPRPAWPDPAEQGEDQPLNGIFQPADPDTRRELEHAQQALKEQHYTEGVQLLQRILDSSEDYFYRPSGDRGAAELPGRNSIRERTLTRGIKAEVQRIIGELPSAGRSAYELQFGEKAKRLLSEAIEGGDMLALADVVRLYLYTKAGNQATIVLAHYHLDRGQPLAAALCLERLRRFPADATPFQPALSLTLASSYIRGNYPERAVLVLKDAKRDFGQTAITAGGQQLEWYKQESQSLAWLQSTMGNATARHGLPTDQWALFRGDPSRNAQTSAGQPLLSPRWQVSLVDQPAAEKSLRDVRQSLLNRGQAILPEAHALAIDNTVLTRAGRRWIGVDFVTGKRKWVFPPPILQRESSAESAKLRFHPAAEASAEEQPLDESIYGTLASDGKLVFVLQESSQRVSVATLRNNRRNLRDPGNQSLEETNTLSAIEIAREGALCWTVGGNKGEDEPQTAGTFFLGPPLPLAGKLYVIGEVKGEIRLFVLDAASGKHLWSQQLSVVDPGTGEGDVYRTCGITPSLADGVLVCPTANGAAVAVDINNRSLLWGFPFSHARLSNGDVFGGPNAAYQGVFTNNNATQWADSCATLAEGRAILSPIEANQLFCLNMADGSLVWQMPRGENLYVAGVHQGNVLLVGSRQFQAFKLQPSPSQKPNKADLKRDQKMGEVNKIAASSPTPVWKNPPQFSLDATPSGRGYMSGNFYYLPMSNAEVLKIDCKLGKIVETIRSRKGVVPGNLICLKNQIISQGCESLEAFYQLEPLQQRVDQALANNANDVEALTRRGEMLLEQGKINDAVSTIRRAYQLEAKPQTRDLLVESLLAGLAADFNAYRAPAAEVEPLIETPQDRHTYYRLLSAGLARSGDIDAALQAYFKVAEQHWKSSDLEKIDATLSINPNCWLNAQLQRLLETVSKPQAEQIDAALRRQLQRALSVENNEALRHFIDSFGVHPLADDARLTLLDRLKSLDASSNPLALLQSEQLLLELAVSADAAKRGPAEARLSQLLTASNVASVEQRAQYQQSLVERYGDQPIFRGQDGKIDLTARQYLDALTKEDPVRRALNRQTHWPLGEVTESYSTQVTFNRDGNNPRDGMLDIEIIGSRGPFFEGLSLGCANQNNQPVILAIDAAGNEVWRTPIDSSDSRVFNRSTGEFLQAMVHGHLLVVSLGAEVVAIDALRPGPQTAARVLWRQDLAESNTLVGSRAVENIWGPPRMTLNPANRTACTLGGVTAHGVCVQRGRDLLMLNAISGDVLWQRSGMGSDNEIFADDNVVILAPPGEGDATVLRTIDGAMLGKRRIPEPKQRWGVGLGRRVITWNTVEGGQQLMLRDLWTQTNLWTSPTLAAGSKATLVEQDALAVIQPDGHFQLLALADGRPKLDVSLEKERAISSLAIVRDRSRMFVLVGNRSLGSTKPVASSSDSFDEDQPFADSRTRPLFSGKIYSFDRARGERLWLSPANVDGYVPAPHQMPESPVLVFVQNKDQQAAILSLDKLSGRAVSQNHQFKYVPYNFSVNVNPLDQKVRFSWLNNHLELTFNERPPVPPEAPFQSISETPSAIRGVIKIFGGLR